MDLNRFHIPEKQIPVDWLINEVNQPIDDTPLELGALGKEPHTAFHFGEAGEILAG
jgi:hypothetical protein